jgi:hypothetical protein
MLLDEYLESNDAILFSQPMDMVAKARNASLCFILGHFGLWWQYVSYFSSNYRYADAREPFMEIMLELAAAFAGTGVLWSVPVWLLNEIAYKRTGSSKA